MSIVIQEQAEEKPLLRPLNIKTKVVKNGDISTQNEEISNEQVVFQSRLQLRSDLSTSQSMLHGKTHQNNRVLSVSGSSNVSPVASTSGKVATPVKEIEAALNAFIGFDEESDEVQTPIETSGGNLEMDYGFVFDDIDQASDSITPPFSGPPLESKEQVDKMEINNLINSIAKCGERLHELHKQYRIQYAAKEKFTKDCESVSLNGCQVPLQLQEEISEINKQMNEILRSMYESYIKMSEELREITKYPLDFTQERFIHAYQMYCEDFAKTQAHLIQAGAQQMAYQQKDILRISQYPVATTPCFGNILYNQTNTGHATIAVNKRPFVIGSNTSTLTIPFVETNKTPNYTQTVILPTIYQSMTPHLVTHRPHQEQSIGPHSAPRGSGTKMSSHFDFGQINAIRQQQATLAINEHLKKITGNGTVDKERMEKNAEIRCHEMEEAIEKLLCCIVPSTCEIKNISTRVCQSLCNLLKGEDFFKNGKIIAYGASEQNLFYKYSNFNFCFCSSNLHIKPTEAIQLMADLMKKHTVFDKVQWIICNNRPVLTFVDTKTSAKCELVINMIKEVGASRFVAAFASMDTRFRNIAILIKYWAHHNKLFKGLSSYSLVLLVINFLQHKRVLPIISTAVEESGESEWSRRDDYEININKYKEFSSKQTDLSSKLVSGFFRYFAFEFDYNNYVVSVRTGSNLKKTEKKWAYPTKKNQFAIEDPLDSGSNLGKMMDCNLLHAFQSECANIYQKLCNTQDIARMFNL